MENFDEKKDPQSITPPAEVFTHQAQTVEEKIVDCPLHIFTGKIDVPPEGGMNLWFEGVPYPKKGFPFAEASLSINVIKRQTMMIIMPAMNKVMALPILGFMLTPYKKKIKIIENFLNYYVRNADYLLRGVYLKPKFMTPCAQQIQKFIDLFLKGVGVSADAAEGAARVLSIIVEYDDAYRYRIEDIFTETSKTEMLAGKGKEIRRLLKIMDQREKARGVEAKFNAFGKALQIVMMHRCVKKSYMNAISALTFDYLQLDEADRYHTLNRGDYDYEGRSQEDRRKEYDEIHDGNYPPMVEYK